MTRADEGADAEPLRLLDVLRRTTEFLRMRGCDAPRLDAELLLARGLGLARLDLYLQFDRPLLEAELAPCRELVRRRGAREPLAYLLGTKEFRSLDFEVNRDVLVPRPDTETLVEETLSFLGERAGAATVADVGTGSGAVAVSLAHARPGLRVVATDVARAALAVASRNAARHGVADRVTFHEGPFLDPLPAEPPLDAIASNPPYVLPEEEASLPPELRFEPREALFVPGGDLEAIYGRLAEAALRRLRGGGALLVEVGDGQAARVEATLAAAGLAPVRRARDLGGAERVLVAVKAAGGVAQRT